MRTHVASLFAAFVLACQGGCSPANGAGDTGMQAAVATPNPNKAGVVAPLSFALVASRTLDVEIDPNLTDRMVVVKTDDGAPISVVSVDHRAQITLPADLRDGTTLVLDVAVSADEKTRFGILYDGSINYLWTGTDAGYANVLFDHFDEGTVIMTNGVARFTGGNAILALSSETQGKELVRSTVTHAGMDGLAWFQDGDASFKVAGTVPKNEILSLGFITDGTYRAWSCFMTEEKGYGQVIPAVCP